MKVVKNDLFDYGLEIYQDEKLEKLGFNTTVEDKKSGEDKDSAMEKVLKKQKGMLKERMSIDKIMKFTGLTKEEIEKLK